MSAALRPDEAESSPKRRQILEAATDLFIAHGYGAVSMDAVAKAASVSKATLYAHFASKDQLFATIVAEACRKNAPKSDLPEPGGELRASLIVVGCKALRFLLQERTLAVYRVAVAESARFPELGRAFYQSGPYAARQLLADWIAQQVAAGRLKAADPAVAAEQFMALIRGGLFLRASLGVPPAPTEEEIDASVTAAVDSFLAAFRPD